MHSDYVKPCPSGDSLRMCLCSLGDSKSQGVVAGRGAIWGAGSQRQGVEGVGSKGSHLSRAASMPFPKGLRGFLGSIPSPANL